MQLIARMVVLVPPAGCALVKYFGVLAPAARTRPRIVPAVSPRKRKGKPAGAPRPSATSLYPWADLLKRTFLEDVTRCPCGGRLTLIAVVTSREGIDRMVTHFGVKTATRPP